MPNIKTISLNILLFSSVVAIEVLLIRYAVPATVLDIMLDPLMVIFLYYLIKTCFYEKNKQCLVTEVPRTSLTVCVAYLFFSLFLMGLGGWSAYTGVLNPLGYFTGVKGAAHGYTLFLLGLFIIFISILIFVVQIKQLSYYMSKE